MKIVALDFEFNSISEAKLNLVSVACDCYEDDVLIYRRFFWLYKAKERQLNEARTFFLNRIKEEYVFVAYVMEAEARGLMSLFLGRKWLEYFYAIDLYLEYRCLLNHNHKFAYGEQYINGKVIKTTPPPNKWELRNGDYGEDDEAHHKPSYSLAAAVFKLLGEKIDTEEKTRVRGIIIKGDTNEINAARDGIEAYNKSDIKYLFRLLTFFRAHYITHDIGSSDFWLKAALSRGDYAVRTARMTAFGYPVNQEKLIRFKENTANILAEAAKACNEVAGATALPFRFDKRLKRYVMVEKTMRSWVEAQGKPNWRKTAGKALSLSKDAFGDWYDSASEGLAGAYCRYLKTKQSLNGFMPGVSKRGQFHDFVGTDGRVRPYFGIYGSQSSRSQPGATAFIPLKAHWMRNFLEAPNGKALAGIDYSSQEFLVAATLSQDEAMMTAYASGDVYLAFAKEANLAPTDATKDSHKKVRDICKALVLGISYDMSAGGLAPRLSQVMKETVTVDYAQNLIDLFYATYYDYAEWKKEMQNEYRDNGYLVLPDGWVMWGDNDNPRSVGNFPVQGHGAVIMREAVRRAQDAGLDVVFTLHDALYIEFDAFDRQAVVTLMHSMLDAFEHVMKDYGKTVPMRLEGEAWAPVYADKTPDAIDGVNYLSEYVDAKGASDLERYRPFFTKATPVKGDNNGISESIGETSLL